MNESVIVTGGAGFIGSHLCEALLKQGRKVCCLDNLEPFYAIHQKQANIRQLKTFDGFQFLEGDICDPTSLKQLPPAHTLFHLAARVGVRDSVDNTAGYIKTNIEGTLAILQFCHDKNISDLILASSSSVYGNDPAVPWQEIAPCKHLLSPCAVTKRSAELMADTCARLYGLRIACLRFFTVYGSRQRPDMAISKFTRQLLNDQCLSVYGSGDSLRDYTHVFDIVKGILQAEIWLKKQANAICETFNLGNQHPISLRDVIGILENETGKKAQIEYLSEHPGDLNITCADIGKSQKLLKYNPSISFKEGVQSFVEWFQHQ